jgi:hypothetical protein
MAGKVFMWIIAAIVNIIVVIVVLAIWSQMGRH